MRVIYTRHFVKLFESHDINDQNAIYKAVEETIRYVGNGYAAYGLRIKKLHGHIYESGVSRDLRMIFYLEADVVKFFGVGNHDDIRRCLKRYGRGR